MSDIVKSLQMTWTASSIQEEIVPEGYLIRGFLPGDEEAYCALMQKAGFDAWGREQLDKAVRTSVRQGIRFIISGKDESFVATAGAFRQPNPYHPEGGEMGWVAVDPASRGRGLGGVVVNSATKRLIETGFTDIYLQTDDFRLPAIKTYLKLGWKPFLYIDGMKERWDNVTTALGISS